jgi:AP-1 complex subunit beta-1
MSKNKKATGSDSKFFTTNRKGENHELREELKSSQRDKKRDAVKKVIANMTIGKDVSPLFHDVINCIQTENLELKKLVYLYLINYAKTQPDSALLAVNTFVKDANDPNPLIRALAIRTMGCIRVEKITEYLCEPLSRCLKDEDPYVRKTAAVCVAKLYDISPELVEDRGFVDTLRDMISDANPTVVANAVSALSEISENSGTDMMMVTANVLQKLLAALNECTEWGQVFILDSLSQYTPQDSREAEGIIERVSPRLQHANSAVVLSAVKVILRYLDDITNEDLIRTITKKLAPPLVTLLNSEAEIQYVALRNINLIILKRPKILEHEVKVFFCKYNDPIYVKMEKLEIIVRLCSDRNAGQVLLELKEYATEVDVDFVRRAVRAVGRCAIKLEQATERCINVLLDLIKTKVSYVVQEAVIVIKDIFRKYPNRYESIISTLCENLEDLDEPEAKASMIWIIGEYADRIDNADELLDSFLETFQEETSVVQLQLLTATVKLFLKMPENTQEMVQRVLNLATEHSDNPDLRDRGYVYWRLLSSDPEAARAVVLSVKPQLGDDTFTMEPALLDELMGQIATLSSIYHKPPQAFVTKTFASAVADEDEEEEPDEEPISTSAESYVQQSSTSGQAAAPSRGGGDLLDLLDDEPTPAPVSASSSSGSSSSSAVDFMGGGYASGGSDASSSVAKTCVVTADVGHGVAINAAFTQSASGQLQLVMDISNSGLTPVSALVLQLNKNAMGIAPVNPQVALPKPIANNASCTAIVPLFMSPPMMNPQDGTMNIQSAMKNTATNGVFYFVLPFKMEVLYKTGGYTGDVKSFGGKWQSAEYGGANEVSDLVSGLPTVDVDAVSAKLAAKKICFVTKRDIPGQVGQVSVFYSAVTLQSDMLFLIELKFKQGVAICKVTVRSSSKNLSELCKQLVKETLLA